VLTSAPPPRPNRKQRFALAHKAVKEGRAELLLAGCDLLEARKSAVNPKRRSVAALLREVWKTRAALKRIDAKAKETRT
jgi:hypothetical protein